MFRWVTKQQLAGGWRPRLRKESRRQVPKSTVDAWMKDAKTSFVFDLSASHPF
jgi:hypothetical protein